jgi:hypothetical protein
MTRKKLACTKQRLAVMRRVLVAEVAAIPTANGWRWQRRATTGALDARLVGALTAADSRTMGELLDARLVRVSAAAGRATSGRLVFATEAGRYWVQVGYRARRGCTNGNRRGSSTDRRRRRQWLLDTYGDGTTAPCWLAVPGVCAGPVTAETLSVERVKPGHAGGTYARENIRPACQPCQSHQGGSFTRDLVAAAACST